MLARYQGNSHLLVTRAFTSGLTAVVAAAISRYSVEVNAITTLKGGWKS